MNLLRTLFLISLVLTGFFAGIGFVNARGLIPAVEDTTVQHVVPDWQHLDYYMRSRMPIPGAAMLLSFVLVLVRLARQKPVNPEQVSASFEVQKDKLVHAFYLRSIPVMLSSVLMILAYFRFEAAHSHRVGAPAERPLATL